MRDPVLPATPPGGVARPRILLVVDEASRSPGLSRALSERYRICLAETTESALRIAATAPQPALVVLSPYLPREQRRRLEAGLCSAPSTRDLPVLIAGDGAQEPPRPHVPDTAGHDATRALLADIAQRLAPPAARDRLEEQNMQLRREIDRLEEGHDFILDANLHLLTSLSEARDLETGRHQCRTQAYVAALVRKLAEQPRYAAQLPPARRAMIVKAAQLHDIGKIGIPDAILFKPGKLTPEEFDAMKAHTRIGADAIGKAIDRLEARASGPAQNPHNAATLDFLDIASQIALGHHEKWDGSGYPQGLAGEAIPLPARIVALADVFDALSSHRPYKRPMTLDEIALVILNGRGTHFDPAIVDAWRALQNEFAFIALHHADADEAAAMASMPAAPTPPRAEPALPAEARGRRRPADAGVQQAPH